MTLSKNEFKPAFNETEARIVAVAYKAIDNDSGYYEALKKLVIAAPTKQEYWRELVVVLKRQSFFAPRYELDLLRLMASKQLIADANDHLYYAETALKLGFPHEAADSVVAAASIVMPLQTVVARNVDLY